VKKKPEQILIIHYSSQSLFDEVEDGFSPRITSIVVMHFASRQTMVFALHTIAEELGVAKDDVESRYDEIERTLLERFYSFAKDNFDKCWMHWNMRHTVFGFEHLEHRYRVLAKQAPPTIPYDNRVNISDVLKYHYGGDYAPDPRMTKLMEMNSRPDKRFLSGAEEAAAFQRKEFIRMSGSTLSKVEFFRFVLQQAARGKLETAGRGILVRLDRLLESRSARLIALASAVIALPASFIALWALVAWLWRTFS
jgi:hypothetical protein